MKKLTLLLAMTIASCATPVVHQHKTLDNEEICCADVSQLPITPIKAGNELKVVFRPGAPVFDYGAGKSYTAVLELPPNNDYYFIARSFFNGLEIGQFFQPIFISLDENYQATEVFTLDMRFFTSTWTRNGHMGAAFKLPRATKYLAIFTSQLDQEAPVANIAPSVSATIVGDIPIVTSNPGYGYELTPTPTGIMKFELKFDKDRPNSK